MLVAALHWPAECLRMGEVYREAATLRDRGRPLDEVLRSTDERRFKLAITHTYLRKDMSPRDWYWAAVGICVGQKDDDGRATPVSSH
jgi:hypothetical protein